MTDRNQAIAIQLHSKLMFPAGFLPNAKTYRLNRLVEGPLLMALSQKLLVLPWNFRIRLQKVLFIANFVLLKNVRSDRLRGIWRLVTAMEDFLWLRKSVRQRSLTLLAAHWSHTRCRALQSGSGSVTRLFLARQWCALSTRTSLWLPIKTKRDGFDAVSASSWFK